MLDYGPATDRHTFKQNVGYNYLEQGCSHSGIAKKYILTSYFGHKATKENVLLTVVCTFEMYFPTTMY